MKLAAPVLLWVATLMMCVVPVRAQWLNYPTPACRASPTASRT